MVVCERKVQGEKKRKQKKEEGFNPDSTVLIKHHSLLYAGEDNAGPLSTN